RRSWSGASPCDATAGRTSLLPAASGQRRQVGAQLRHLFRVGGFVVSPDASLGVEQHYRHAVQDRVGRGVHRDLRGGGDFEAVAGEIVQLLLGSRQKEPARGV